MRCYFYADKTGKSDDVGDGVVSFTFPEFKITFRARHRGTMVSCEYAALLALLEFIEINPKLFEGRTLEIFGDSFAVVNQVNNRQFCHKELVPMRNMALGFKRKIPYVIGWVSATDNPAQGNSARG